MSQSGFNLEKLKDVVKEGELAAHPELIRLLSNSSSVATTCKAHKQAGKYSDGYIEKLRLISTTKIIWKFPPPLFFNYLVNDLN